MHRLKVFRQMKMLSSAPVIAGTVAAVTIAAVGRTNVVFAAPPPEQPLECDPNRTLVRAKDLPLYFDPENKLHSIKECKKEEYPDDYLMDLIKWGREEAVKVQQGVADLKTKTNNFLETGHSHLMVTIEELREPENSNKRYAFIGGSSLFGFILGIRGGFLKKLFCTSVGAAASAALCYPEEAEDYSSLLIEMIKEYSTIAYHFTHAAFKDLTGTDLSIPQFIKIKPFATIKEWVSHSSENNGDDVSKSSPSSASLLPPVAETPSHVMPSSLSSKPDNSGSIPLPPLEKPTKSDIIETKRLRDQSNPEDKDLYSLRG